MRALLRRNAREVLDDATDRLRCDVPAALCLHVLPSLPFVAVTLWWFVDVDLRGTLPEGRDPLLAVLLVPKLMGWGALSAWAVAGARSRPIGVLAAWRRAFARGPEVLLAGAIALLGIPLGFVSASLGWLISAMGWVGLAAAVGPRAAGGFALTRAGSNAVGADVARCWMLMFAGFVAWAFLIVNLLLLPHLLVQLGAGSLGFDMHLIQAALGPDRAASWAGASLLAGLAVEALVVVAFAELSVDRDAERDGTRFEVFVQDLEQRRARAAEQAPTAAEAVA